MARIVRAAEIRNWLAYYNFRVSEEADLPSILFDSVEREINSQLEKSSYSFDAISELPDPKKYILDASLCFALEALEMRGQIQVTSGDVASTKVGDVETKFQRWQPMFFFAKGKSDSFYQLLPKESYHMKGVRKIRMYNRWRFKKKVGGVPFGSVSGNLEPGSKGTYTVYGTDGDLT